MEEEEDYMFRHLISHFHDLSQSQLYASHSPPSHSLYLRWCVHGLDENPIKGNCNNATMTADKSTKFKTANPCRPPPTKRSRKERNHGKKHLGPLKDSSEIMEQEIWRELPEDLLEAVIARLPISTFFLFRSVCRKWNSLLSSPSFSEHCAQVPKSQPWFYIITHENVNTAAVYDPSTKKWRHPTIPVLPPKIILLPVASDGGLVCFLDIEHRYFYVCNPLTHSWKELPARSFKVWSRVAVGMMTSQDGHAYKILWVGRDGDFEIYDSLEDSWSRPGSFPPSMKLPLSLNFRSHSVSTGGTVYFMRSEPEGIVSYEMEKGVWRDDPIPPPPNSTDHNLAEWGGRVYLVGLLTKNAATCVCVWELQKMMLLWKEVDRMPNVWCLEFYGKHVRMSCLGNKSLLMLSLRSQQMNRIVTYDVARREWLKVPGCVPPCGGRKRQWIACGTAFYPSLTCAP